MSPPSYPVGCRVRVAGFPWTVEGVVTLSTPTWIVVRDDSGGRWIALVDRDGIQIVEEDAP